MNVVCLDLEGVLIPEIWIAFAEKTGIDALKRTTRDEPCYDTLMRYRLEIIREHQFTLQDVQAVIATLSPLPGAYEFISWLKSEAAVIILSDTFAQFAGPLMRQLDYPTLFCHELVIGGNGAINDYRLRQDDQKRRAIEALRSLNFRTIAAGDSYNDLSMIESADEGIFFRPPESLVKEKPQFPVTTTHAELRTTIQALL